MVLDTYMQIEGIPGESLDAVFKDWIELSDFDVGASQSASATATSAGGASSGRASMSDFFFRKAV
ncbi:type VI secretion system tube protein Hcp, partial [Pseudomonas amygdali]